MSGAAIALDQARSAQAEADRAFKCIALTAQPYQRYLLIALAGRLREKFGSTIHLYVARKQDADFFRRNAPQGLLASITVADQLLDLSAVPQRLEDDAAFDQCISEIENFLGFSLNRLAITNRHLGRGFALAGFKHPRSRQSEQTSHRQSMWMLCSQVEFWRREFSEKGATLLLGANIAATMVAAALGLPTRNLIEARNRKEFMWAWSMFDETPLIEQAWCELADPDVPPFDITPPAGHLANRNAVLQQARVLSLLKRMAHMTAVHVYGRLRGYDKAKNYYLGEELRYVMRIRRDLLRMSAKDRPTLADLAGKPFVFYPLHTEPERALQTLSPEYFFQLETIAATARDLPSNRLLVVKEHVAALGRRPADFYDQILEFKNVVLLNILEYGLNIVKQAEVVVTITGTAGLEAASLGKPVVTFGQHNLYNFLPHVHVVRELGDLRKHLSHVLHGGHDEAQARRDGARLRAAMDMVSFPVGSFGEINMQDFGAEDIDRAIDYLGATLAGEPLAASR